MFTTQKTQAMTALGATVAAMNFLEVRFAAREQTMRACAYLIAESAEFPTKLRNAFWKDAASFYDDARCASGLCVAKAASLLACAQIASDDSDNGDLAQEALAGEGLTLTDLLRASDIYRQAAERFADAAVQ